MNEREAQNAIEQMINFINKEAEDRAMEIRKKTEEECTIGKVIGSRFRKGKSYLWGSKENEGGIRQEICGLCCPKENV